MRSDLDGHIEIMRCLFFWFTQKLVSSLLMLSIEPKSSTSHISLPLCFLLTEFVVYNLRLRQIAFEISKTKTKFKALILESNNSSDF